MSPAADMDLFAPFEKDTILEIRTSKMKTMPGLTIQSGIDKELRSGKIHVTYLGLVDDEHDPTFHGGKDKAIHGYCSSHYTQWKQEFPDAEARFKPGGFGENFVTEFMNERNICIGDVFSVGNDGVLLQISLPRQPCFKLNHRFKLKNFAPNTYKKSRTGWYYRVLREGTVQAGDEIRLVERKWPMWTVERVQEYLHRTTDNTEMNEELSEIPDMGDECRKAFLKRVAKFKAQQKRAANQDDKAEKWRDYKVVEKKAQTSRITSFMLEAVTPDPDIKDSDVKLGPHVRLRLPNGLLRSYSIVSGTDNRFELGIALEEASRGGSSYLHKNVKEGDMIEVGRITSDLKPASAASNHVFIVGGIGITAFLSMMEAYRQINWETTLHYALRTADDMPFRGRVEGLKESVKLYDRSKGQRMNIGEILRNLTWNSHVYVCGPQRMLDEAVEQAKKCDLGEDDIHFEAFSVDATGDPFEAEVVNRGGQVLKVAGEETLLEVLRKSFDDVPSSCEVGNCGTCRVTVKNGNVEHRGTALTAEDKKEAMLSCVSRGIGRIAIEI
ncbi:PK beta-barrel-protein domain-containing protein-like protein [Xylaria bambusicola]|uniref:PK beta-barrel-protein domain-containing protein-like protein n=1 Tax=Xylaria bambusicola TaxID=326684 RepID=UPI0020079C42|nr:PK beta-barrel-protein domain-containing protein-like protein [Xylaria bambusicola]KAI0521911.1 PK beta-barrel-protein domain-containing protein-like protein [Xylaria bambusicola]